MSNTKYTGITKYTLNGNNGRERTLYRVEFRYKNSLGESKKHKKSGFEHLREAKEYMENFKAKEQKTCDIKFKYVYNDYIDELYKACTKTNPEIKASTAELKMSMLRNHIFDFFKDMPMSSIDRNTINEWKDYMDDKRRKEYSKHPGNNNKVEDDEDLKEVGLSVGYLNRCYSYLSQILNYAVDNGYITMSPMIGVRRFKNVNKTENTRDTNKKYWNEKDCYLFLEKSKERKAHFYFIFETLIFSGARIGEVLALRKKDIDFENKVIVIEKNSSGKEAYIDKAYEELEDNSVAIKYKRATTSPKTGKARELVMPDTYFKDIERYLTSMPELEDDDCIFPVCKKTVQNTFNAILNQLEKEGKGLKRITLHGLRHSTISMLLSYEDGTYSVNDVSAMVGHSTTAMTHKYYGNIYGLNIKMAEMLEKKIQFVKGKN